MENIDRIFYVNLAKRVDKREQIEGELKEHLDVVDYEGRVERFDAIEDVNGAIGCSMSHLEILKIAKEREYKYVMVFEDDFMFLKGKAGFYADLANLFALVENGSLDFKVIMLSYNAIDRVGYNGFLDRTTNVQTTAGYLLNCAYIDAMIDNFSRGIELFKVTGEHWNYAVDQYWKKEQKDKWYLFKNRIGKQRAGLSDIGGCFSDNGF